MIGGHLGRHLEFLKEKWQNFSELYVNYSTHIFASIPPKNNISMHYYCFRLKSCNKVLKKALILAAILDFNE